ncbi:hypothetical protein ONZ45_g5307 [Pleurotus djamor]|nr:hypothetical protein ONZ45_g5307 [Pleurotus djamor]
MPVPAEDEQESEATTSNSTSDVSLFQRVTIKSSEKPPDQSLRHTEDRHETKATKTPDAHSRQPTKPEQHEVFTNNFVKTDHLRNGTPHLMSTPLPHPIEKEKGGTRRSRFRTRLVNGFTKRIIFDRRSHEEQSVHYSGGPVFIAVMGKAGVGKSSFINAACGINHLILGHNLESCTLKIQDVCLSSPMRCDEDIVLWDTPGSDLLDHTDPGGIISLARRLGVPKDTSSLCGMIYLVRIVANRAPLHELDRLVKSLKDACLLDSVSTDNASIVVATTIWDEEDEEIASKRHQLMEMALGRSIFRHHGDFQSAWRVMDPIVQKINANFAHQFDRGLNALIASLRKKASQMDVARRLKELGSELSRLVINIRQSDNVSTLVTEYELKRSELCATLEQIQGHEITREVWRRARLRMSV